MPEKVISSARIEVDEEGQRREVENGVQAKNVTNAGDLPEIPVDGAGVSIMVGVDGKLRRTTVAALSAWLLGSIQTNYSVNIPYVDEDTGHWMTYDATQGGYVDTGVIGAGKSAGFGSISATVDSGVGTPSVTVTPSGPDEAKALAFAFHNLKGTAGARGPRGRGSARLVVGTSTAGWTSSDCDYLCDGTDDQEEIKSAIAALPAGGGEIVILDGTYNISFSINIQKPNITIRGSGDGTVLKLTQTYHPSFGTVHWMFYVEAENTVISGLTFDGNGLTGSRSSAIYIYGVGNTTVMGNHFKDIPGSAVGATMRTVGDRCVSVRNVIAFNRVDGGEYGLKVHGERNVIAFNSCVGVKFEPITASEAHNLIVGNSLCLCTGGINASGNYNTISNNVCTESFDEVDWRKHSVGITVSGRFCTVTGNVCTKSITGINATCSFSTITGNTLIDNDVGINVVKEYNSAEAGNIVADNIVMRGTGETTDYTSSQYTIKVTSGSTNNLIINNIILGKDYTDSGTGNTFSGNKATKEAS